MIGYTSPYSEIIIRSFQTQQEEETMNVNPNTPATEFKPVPVAPLTDAEFKKLLETRTEPLDGEIVGYVTDTDEASDEPTPTIH